MTLRTLKNAIKSTTLLAALNWVDAISTYALVTNGIAREVNPIMNFLLEVHPLLFLVFKFALSVFILEVLSRYRFEYREKALTFVNTVYCTIIMLHVYIISCYIIG